MIRNIALVSILFFSLVQISISQEAITIRDAWVRETPPGSSVSAAYMTIENKGESDKLISITSDIADTAEIHTTKVDDNSVATMEMIKELDMPSGKTLELKPGGMHIMLIGLKESLVGKKSVDMKLNFEESGEIEIEVPVKKSTGSSHKHHH